ncbi:MAG TPA: Lrp/AsnC family transcriptional regulator [Cellulomonadaceae bacterium]|nr:Lrp/AsnC family transcriptional regulator [Cellulomonadaceae bacterium]
MGAHDSVSSRGSSTASQEVRTASLDEVDRRILHLLQQDARMPNNALAASVGIAPSTCLARVRTLRTAGVIRGFHAEVDPAALGRGLQAMVAVRMQSGARNRLSAFAQRLAARPEVLDLYFVAGADDFLVHVAVEDSDALREFVLEQLSAFPEVALTETSLIFEHVRTSSARSR